MCNVRWFLVPIECNLTCFTFLSETVVSVIISYENLPWAKLSWGSSTLFTAKTLKKTSITLRSCGKAVMDKSVKIFRQPPPPSNHSKRGQLAPENVSDGVTDNKSIPFFTECETRKLKLWHACNLLSFLFILVVCFSAHICWFMWSYSDWGWTDVLSGAKKTKRIRI